MQKKRYAIIAMLMHLVTPGLGFLYAGKIWSAILVPLLLIFVVFSLGWSRLLLEPWGVTLLWGSLLLIYFFLLPLVSYSTKNNRSVSVSRSVRWIAYLLFIAFVFIVFTCVVYFRSSLFGYETFRLPTRSMANTLLPKDYVIADTWAYRDSLPKRGDIVVFKRHNNSVGSDEPYITKRVVALPGELVSISKNGVEINKLRLSEPYVLASNNQLSSRNSFSEQMVPDNHYFMLGDNRDHSNDSRVWGFLHEDAIYGKVISIWFSFSSDGIRTQRIRSVLLKGIDKRAVQEGDTQ